MAVIPLSPWQEGAIQAQEAVLRVDEPPPELLHHYTNAAGFAGIAESGSIRAYGIRQMNDSSEWDYGLLRIGEAIANARPSASEAAHSFLTHLDTMLAHVRDLESVFVACFSSAGNDLSQWRAYKGASSGFALAFRTKDVTQQVQAATDPLASQPFRRVVYDQKEQRQRAAALISAAIRSVDATTDQGSHDWLVYRTAERASALVCTFKNPAYAAEREWRLVVRQGVLKRNVKAHAAGDVLKMYVDLLGKPPLPIAEVMIGPGGEAQADAAIYLMHQHGHQDNFVVRISDIPER